MNLSLRNKFLIPMLILIIFGMGLSSGISYYKSKSALESSVKGQIEQIADSTAKVMASWVKDRKLDVTSLGLQKIFAISLQDSFMGKAARKTANLQLKKFSEDYKYYENICVADKSGNIISAADESVIGKANVADSEYFKKALKGDISVSNVLKSRGTGNPIFVIATPVKGKGVITGVFFGMIDVNSFSKRFVDTIKVGKTGYAYIYMEDGTVIAHPDKSNIMTLNMNDFDFGRKMIEMKNGQIVYTYNNIGKLVSFNKINEIGWTAAVGAGTSELLAPIRSLGFVNLVVAVSVVVLAAIFILLLTHSVVKPIKRISGYLNEGANQVASASGQVSSASQSLAEGSSEQAASIEETSSSMEEMSSMTKRNAENANHADNLMKEANQVVVTANESMGQLTQSMEDISKASEETSKIIKTIDEIAFQTNLLALNAAVEAARAGEAGAGFAVVADEVRNLAMRAADAAKNTSELIEGTVKKVGDGSELVATTNAAFGKVAESTAKVGDLVSEISEASKEQSNGIEQVNTAITEMDSVVQRTAANAEESASASEEMSAQAKQLREHVGDLVALITGKKNQVAEMGHHTNLNSASSQTSFRKSEKTKSLVLSKKEVRPEQVITFDDEEFKNF